MYFQNFISVLFSNISKMCGIHSSALNTILIYLIQTDCRLTLSWCWLKICNKTQLALIYVIYQINQINKI